MVATAPSSASPAAPAGPAHPGLPDGAPDDERFNGMDSLPFLAVHGAALLAPLTGISATAIAVAVLLYFVRMFAITAGYHRYFSHRSFKTSRAFQFLLGFVGASSAQMGPLWWAAHHRHHHRHSDTELDIHSPGLKGLWWAHAGWILCSKYVKTNMQAVPDLARFRELVFLNDHHLVAPITLACAVFGLGVALERWAPGLGTNGLQMLAWGFFVSTVLLYHGTFTINSLAHLIGRRRFQTGDSSRNSFLLSLITLGEGWHNNHHRYPYAERQGLYWWEIDITHYGLVVLSWLGLVWDLRGYPEDVYEEARTGQPPAGEAA